MPFDPSPLDTILEEAVSRGVVPGAAVVITDREQTLYEGAAGARQAGGAPVDAQTIFRYASCTKVLTSIAALQLVEQGKLDVEAEVASVLPEFGRLQVLDGFDGDTPVLRAPSRPPLVRELLTHTAGPAYFFTNAAVARYHELTGIPNVLTGRRTALTDVPLGGDPGTVWDYGTSTDWLGLVVERLSGQTLGAYLDEHVTGPLGMRDVTFTPSEEQRARAMPIHARTPDGGLVATELDLPPDAEWAAGGHGLHGTAAAFARLLRTLLRGGELDGVRVLSEESVALMFEPQLGGVPLPPAGVKTAAPQFCNDVPPLPFAQSWGFGLHLVLEDVPGMRRAGTGDWAGLFNLYFWIDRTSGIAGMFLTQLLPFFDAKIVETCGAIEVATYEQAAVGSPG